MNLQQRKKEKSFETMTFRLSFSKHKHISFRKAKSSSRRAAYGELV
jgi:hypothetical protein